MSKKLSIRDLPLQGKKTLIRVDFNVPQDSSGNITDDTRIQSSLNTINYVIDHGGIPILMSHLGRPKGSVKPQYSLAPCAERLSKFLGKDVIMAPNCIGPEVQQLVSNLKQDQVLLLENLRFHQGEEKPNEDPSFAKELSSLGDLYINDAFGTAHRAHASTVSIAQFFPKASASGFLLEKEITFLGENLLNPQKPFYAIIGGAKVSTKLGVIESLIKKVDGLIIVGGMAFTFLKAQNISIGNSLCEDSLLQTSLDVCESCKKHNTHLLLPEDFVIAKSLNNDAKTKIVKVAQGIENGYMGLDIGPLSIKNIEILLKNSSTIFWNGPAGVCELSSFAKGTQTIAKFLANSSALTIIGGGDSVAAIKTTGLENNITHISTGGGAALEYIQFGHLPGIEALSPLS